jgi:glycosyltransferase involved in cell wall biosynthesis
LICSAGELFGGVERHILALATGLLARDIAVSLVVFHDAELAAQARDAGIDVMVLPAANRVLWSTARRLARMTERLGVRIVHAHGYKATVTCALAQRMRAFALVRTVHGLPERDATRPLATLRGRVYSVLETIATRAAGARSCYVTRDLREHDRRRHAGQPADVIANGVVPMDGRAYARPAALASDAFNLVVVGRLERVKGQALAIDALATSTIPGDVHLYLLGTGPCDDELRQRVALRGVFDRVHLMGFRRDALDYIAHCDAMLLPSLHEGLPYVLLEAMALGTPVIASRVGGLAEVLDDGATGILFPPGDKDALARAIVRLHDDPALARRLADNARRLQRARYSVDAMIDGYIGVYGNALAAQ